MRNFMDIYGFRWIPMRFTFCSVVNSSQFTIYHTSTTPILCQYCTINQSPNSILKNWNHLSLCNESNVRHFVRLFVLRLFHSESRIRNIRIIINQFASYFSAPKRVPLQGSGGRDHHPDGRPKLSYESLFPSNVMNVTCYMYKLYICMTHLSP